MVTNQRLRSPALVPLWMDGASGAGQCRAGEAAKCACQTGWVLKRAWWRRWKIHLIFHVEGPVKRDQRSTSPYPMEVETLQTKVLGLQAQSAFPVSETWLLCDTYFMLLLTPRCCGRCLSDVTNAHVCDAGSAGKDAQIEP